MKILTLCFLLFSCPLLAEKPQFPPLELPSVQWKTIPPHASAQAETLKDEEIKAQFKLTSQRFKAKGFEIDKIDQFTMDGKLYSETVVYFKNENLIRVTADNYHTDAKMDIRYDQKQIYIHFVKKGESDFDVMDREPNIHLWFELHRLIKKNWDQLAKKQTIEFELLVPYIAKTFSFEINKVADEMIQNKPASRFSIQASNWLISKMMDPIFYSIEKQPPHRILFYQGPIGAIIKGEDKPKRVNGTQLWSYK